MSAARSRKRAAPNRPQKKAPDIDLSRCVRCRGCEELCPDVFRLNPAGYMEIIPRDDFPWDRIEEAMVKCPKDCILMVGTEQTGEN
ncbi:MAG: ferredoxin [Pseudomonadota bacterium]